MSCCSSVCCLTWIINVLRCTDKIFRRNFYHAFSIFCTRGGYCLDDHYGWYFDRSQSLLPWFVSFSFLGSNIWGWSDLAYFLGSWVLVSLFFTVLYKLKPLWSTAKGPRCDYRGFNLRVNKDEIGSKGQGDRGDHLARKSRGKINQIINQILWLLPPISLENKIIPKDHSNKISQEDHSRHDKHWLGSHRITRFNLYKGL